MIFKPYNSWSGKGMYILTEEEKERVEEILNELTIIFGANSVTIEAPTFSLGRRDITLNINGSLLGVEEDLRR